MPFSCFLFRPRKRLEKRRKRSHTNVSNASVIRFSTPPAQTATFAFTSESGYTHSAFGERWHTAAYTPKQGTFRMGRYHYPRHELHVHEHPRAGCQNGKLCRFWVLVGRCSQRTQRACGTAMRLCASLFQGVAAPLGCVIFFRFCRNYGFHTLCSGLSACARHRRYHYPRRALRASETLDSRLSKRLSCYSFRPS